MSIATDRYEDEMTRVKVALAAWRESVAASRAVYRGDSSRTPSADAGKLLVALADELLGRQECSYSYGVTDSSGWPASMCMWRQCNVHDDEARQYRDVAVADMWDSGKSVEVPS